MTAAVIALITATCFCSFAKIMKVTIVAAWTWRLRLLLQLAGFAVTMMMILAVTVIAELRLAPLAQTSAPWAWRRHLHSTDSFFNYFPSPFI